MSRPTRGTGALVRVIRPLKCYVASFVRLNSLPWCTSCVPGTRCGFPPHDRSPSNLRGGTPRQSEAWAIEREMKRKQREASRREGRIDIMEHKASFPVTRLPGYLVIWLPGFPVILGYESGASQRSMLLRFEPRQSKKLKHAGK